MAKLAVVARPPKGGSGAPPLCIWISHQNSTRNVSLGLTVEPKHWNARVGEVRKTLRDYLIQLHVLHFEGLAPEGEAYLLADWKIIDPQDGAVLDRGTTDYRAQGWTVGAYDELAALLDVGVRELSDDLIASLERLAAPRRRAGS